jgi:hypothetical protein
LFSIKTDRSASATFLATRTTDTIVAGARVVLGSGREVRRTNLHFEGLAEQRCPMLVGVDNAQMLLNGGVQAAQQWLDRANANPADVPSNFNWLAFAFGAGTRAHSASTIEDADAWASISIRVYEQLATSLDWAASAELSAMNLRAWMIRRYGASELHPVRDVRQLVRWFEQATSMQYNEVRGLAERLRAIPIDLWSEQLDLVRQLRAMKNRINVFRTLDDPPDVMRPWLELWSLLP